MAASGVGSSMPAHPRLEIWPDVVAYVDQMLPLDPSWRQVEAEVDARTQPDVGRLIAEQPPTRVDYEDLFDKVRAAWLGHLRTLYPRVYNVVRASATADESITRYGVTAWVLLKWFPNDVGTWVHYMSGEWETVQNSPLVYPAYTMQRLSVTDAKAIMRYLAEPQNARLMTQLRKARYMPRFRRDIGDLAMQDRTILAQSGLIDRVATFQGSDVAQMLARYIDPDAITLARPLRTREHASHVAEKIAAMSDSDRASAVLARTTTRTGGRMQVADGMTRLEYLESILDVMRAPDAQAAPTATLARAGAMLDILMQSIEQQQQPQQQQQQQ